MNKSRHHITVFEHESIRFDKGDKKITKEQFDALQMYYGQGVPFYDLTYNGVRFKEYVGVIQVGNTLIEVLPKADRKAYFKSDEDKWRKILIDMLRAVGSIEICSTSTSNLRIKPNTILDIYFEMFIKEVEYLLRNGLVRKYRKHKTNSNALKGNILFAKNIQYNLTHQERFYVCHSTYDAEHLLHFILFKTIRLLSQINTIASLHSRIGALLLNFPGMPDIKITESTFSKLVLNRKTQSYKKAIEIARLIILRYHPDLNKGRNNVLALMFDMNKLWEQFVYVSLRKHKGACFTVTAQTSKYFWEPEYGYRSKIRPDIVINKDKENCIVLDTKWKNLNGSNPSPGDLRQMYVYHEYYNAKKVALVYPGYESGETKGSFLPTLTYQNKDKQCSVVILAVPEKAKEQRSIVRIWQEEMVLKVQNWINLLV